MDLNGAFKQIIENYLQNYQTADLVYGTWGASSVKIDGKPVPIPMDMIKKPKGLTITIGEKVALHQQRGGQQYFVEGVYE